MDEIAQVYARALLEVAREHGRLDEVREQLVQFVDALDGQRELALFFFSPYFSTQEKGDVLRRAVSGADDELLNFLELLIVKHRMPAIFRIRREFDRLWEEAHGRLSVEVTSAMELVPATLDLLRALIGASSGREVELSTRVEPDILGGIVVRVGNAILDASIRNRLQRLRQQVAHAA